MTDYEIRYLHHDGTLSLIFMATCQDNASARLVARKMFPQDCARYEIWTKDGRVGTSPEQQSAA